MCQLLTLAFYSIMIHMDSDQMHNVYRYIPPENVPVQYGGLGKLEDLHNAPVKLASEFTVKGGEKVNLEIDGIEVLFQ